jgi:N-acetylmuramoyl-L-alanine amidase
MVNMPFQITVDFIPGLPQTPFRNGVGAYEGVVAHATDNYGDTDTGERNYEASGAWKNAFVHFFVDDDSITQAADTNYRAWGAGGAANPRFLHVELCQTHDEQKFKAAYLKYCVLIAWLLANRNLGVSFKGTLWGHLEITNTLGGTSHTDPWDYLASHGISKDQFIADVTWWYNELTKPAVAPVSQKAPTPAPTKEFRIKTIPSSLWYYDKPDWNAKKATVPANTVLTVVDTVKVDGSNMYKLKSGTFITANPKYVKII